MAGTEIDNRTASTFEVEERDPFHDRELQEFAFAVPETQLSRGLGKYILRESLRAVLPDALRFRSDKADFSETLARTLLDGAVERTLACPRLVARGYVRNEDIANSYSQFRLSYRGGNRSYIDHVWGLWMAFVLETWVNMMEARSGADLSPSSVKQFVGS